jgi:lipoate synthase
MLFDFSNILSGGIGYGKNLFDDLKPFIFLFLGATIAMKVIELIKDFAEDYQFTNLIKPEFDGLLKNWQKLNQSTAQIQMANVERVGKLLPAISETETKRVARIGLQKEIDRIQEALPKTSLRQRKKFFKSIKDNELKERLLNIKQ